MLRDISRKRPERGSGGCLRLRKSFGGSVFGNPRFNGPADDKRAGC